MITCLPVHAQVSNIRGPLASTSRNGGPLASTSQNGGPLASTSQNVQNGGPHAGTSLSKYIFNLIFKNLII